MDRKSAVGVLRELALPFVVALATGLVFFYGGDAYQAFGLAALDSSRKIVSYVLGIALFLSAAVLLERFTRHVIFDSIVAGALGTPVPRLLKQFSTILIYLTTSGAILAVVFKQDLTVFWAASGVAGVVLGMALRELLQDVFAGLALNIDRPVRIGDNIQLHKVGDSVVEGTVVEISWRTTLVKDLNANLIVVPNNKLASAIITNFSRPENFQKIKLAVTIDATVPHERALRILSAAVAEAAAGFGAGETPPPKVVLTRLSPDGVEYSLQYFAALNQRSAATNQMLQSVLRHLRSAGLRPAMPKVEDFRATGPTWSPAVPSAEDLARLLAAGPPFAGLSPEDVRHLAAAARVRSVAARDEVVHAGETGDRAFVLVEGLLTAVRPRGGGRVLLRPGDGFGMEAALLGEVHPATVHAQSEATLCEIDLPAFQAVFAASPHVAAVLSRHLAAAAGGEAGEMDMLVADIRQTMRRTFADLRFPVEA